MLSKTIPATWLAAGFAGFLGGLHACVPAGHSEYEPPQPLSSASTSVSTKSSASASVVASAMPAVSASASASASTNPQQGLIRLWIGQPLKAPEGNSPAVDFSNNSYAIDGLGYLCKTRPSVTKSSGKIPWKVSLEDCQPMPNSADETANIAYLQKTRDMKRPYRVVYGSPLTRPYSPDAEDEDNTIPWEIRPHQDSTGNIYVVEEGSLYCPKIPEQTPTGKPTTITRRKKKITVHNTYSIGTNICVDRPWIEKTRMAEEQTRLEKLNRALGILTPGAPSAQPGSLAEPKRRAEEQLLQEAEETSRFVSQNILLYGFILFLHLMIHSHTRKDPP